MNKSWETILALAPVLLFLMSLAKGRIESPLLKELQMNLDRPALTSSGVGGDSAR
jgi:hypothetical protein